MKKLWFSLAALALFTACDKDDNGNDKQPELLSKKVARIETTYTEDGKSEKETLEYAYGKDGKLVSIKDGDGETAITYGENEVVVKGQHEIHTYTLENGRAVKFSYAAVGFSYAKEADVYLNGECVYVGEYLSKVSQKDVAEGMEFVENYSFKDGNLMKYSFTVYGEEEGEKYEDADECEFTYGKQPNNLNLDFFAFFTETFSERYMGMLGITGKRSAYFPEMIKYSYVDEETGERMTDTADCKYEPNADGYLTKVTVATLSEKKMEFVIAYEE